MHRWSKTTDEALYKKLAFWNRIFLTIITAYNIEYQSMVEVYKCQVHKNCILKGKGYNQVRDKPKALRISTELIGIKVQKRLWSTSRINTSIWKIQLFEKEVIHHTYRFDARKASSEPLSCLKQHLTHGNLQLLLVAHHQW